MYHHGSRSLPPFAMATLPTSASVRPLFALLSASILLSGCLPSVRGPSSDDGLEDVTFTAEDIATVRAASRSESGAVQTGTKATLQLKEEKAVAKLPVADPALVAQYDAVRKAGGETEAGVWEVTNGFVNVRAEPRSTSALVERVNRGAAVQLLEFTNGEWAKVRLASKKEGFVAHRYLARRTTQAKLEQERQAFANTYYVNYGYVNVRAEPKQASQKLGQIPGQAIVKLQAIEGEWAKVTFEGKTGYVAMAYLRKFEPQFLVRTDTFRVPILRFSGADAAAIQRLRTGVRQVQLAGKRILALRDVADALLADRDPPMGVVVIVEDVRPDTVKLVSQALVANGARATLVLRPSDLGISGITQKTLITLKANGFDLQSAAQTGRDLRSLTTAEVQQELAGSRTLLEQSLGLPVLSVVYPQGKTNERVAEVARKAGYLLGVGDTPQSTFARKDLLQLPSYQVKADMDDEALRKLVQ